jgi:hypothetical protein
LHQALPKSINLSQRWVPCNSQLLKKEGVLRTAWLLPGELPTAAAGAFACEIEKHAEEREGDPSKSASWPLFSRHGRGMNKHKAAAGKAKTTVCVYFAVDAS